ncbi:hypothetical protein H1R20_g12527, partial [Candolleomyces eurysporus]
MSSSEPTSPDNTLGPAAASLGKRPRVSDVSVVDTGDETKGRGIEKQAKKKTCLDTNDHRGCQTGGQQMEQQPANHNSEAAVNTTSQEHETEPGNAGGRPDTLENEHASELVFSDAETEAQSAYYDAIWTGTATFSDSDAEAEGRCAYYDAIRLDTGSTDSGIEDEARAAYYDAIRPSIVDQDSGRETEEEETSDEGDKGDENHEQARWLSAGTHTSVGYEDSEDDAGSERISTEYASTTTDRSPASNEDNWGYSTEEASTDDETRDEHSSDAEEYRLTEEEKGEPCITGEEKETLTCTLQLLCIEDLVELVGESIASRQEVEEILFERLDTYLAQFQLRRDYVLGLLSSTDSFISGSFPLYVLFARLFEPSDLDFFTSQDYHLTVVGYLVKKGYKDIRTIYSASVRYEFPQVQRSIRYHDELEAIHKILELTNGRGRKINIVVSKGSPLLPILQFHSTLVMNYIAPHGIVCLYPLTLRRIGIINYINPLSTKVMDCVDKYVRRGFRMWTHNQLTHKCGVDGNCPQTKRSLHDDHVVHFVFPNCSDKEGALIRQDDAVSATWRLSSARACKKATHERYGFVFCNGDGAVMAR